MSRKRAAAWLCLVAAGYLAAVLVATVTTIGLLLLMTVLTSGGELSPVADLLSGTFSFFIGGVAITLPSALPGFLFVLWLSRRQRWRDWWRFALAGGADAIVALVLFHAHAGGGLSWLPVGLILPTVPAGFLGGLAYWVLAGRRLAAWPGWEPT